MLNIFSDNICGGVPLQKVCLYWVVTTVSVLILLPKGKVYMGAFHTN